MRAGGLAAAAILAALVVPPGALPAALPDAAAAAAPGPVPAAPPVVRVNTYRRGQGARQREEIARAGLFAPPYSGVLRLSGRRGDGASYLCTAAVVENIHVVVTNAHCVSFQGRINQQITVQPAYALSPLDPSYDAQVVYLGAVEKSWGRQSSKYARPEDDYAVLYVRQTLPGRVSPFVLDGSAVSSASDIEAIGFSWDVRRAEALVHVWCHNMSANNGLWQGHDVVFHDCDATEGSSGTPLLYRSGNGLYTLMGIHQGENSDRNGHIQAGVAYSLETTNFGVKAYRFAGAVERLDRLVLNHQPIHGFAPGSAVTQ